MVKTRSCRHLQFATNYSFLVILYKNLIIKIHFDILLRNVSEGGYVLKMKQITEYN